MIRTIRSSSALRLCTAVLVTGTVLLTTACGTGVDSPAAPSGTAVSSVDATTSSAASAPPAERLAAQALTDICHRSAGSNAFIAMSVAAAALGAHLAHGDAQVGSAVPGQTGMVLGPGCVPVTTGRATITFADLPVNEAPFSSYTESGFTVSAVDGAWEALTTYGLPGPSIIFRTPAGVASSAQIRITSGGTDFRFVSVDLYSSITPIPFVFTGLKDSATVFSVSGTEPNTFGNFATVTNPQSAALIDTLFITLANPVTACCDNAMGLDNIVLAR
jgi:hypothetical protein